MAAVGLEPLDTKLLSKEKTEKSLKNKIGVLPLLPQKDETLPQINSQIEKVLSNEVKNNDEHVEEFFSWMGREPQKPLLKTVKARIPEGILPAGYAGDLRDVRVNPPRYGTDDAIYDKHEEIRKRVARGNCFLELTAGPESGRQWCVTYAQRKFTGGLGDDDERDQGDDFTWKRYFLRPIEETSFVVSSDKANGEAAHLAAKVLGDHIILIVGSKNVHLVLRDEDDIHKYTESRYAVAKEIAAEVMYTLRQMSENDRNLFLSFLCHSQMTACFEILNPTHQHVVNLDYLPRPEMNFVSWTSSDLLEESLSSIPLHIGIEMAKAMSLKTVDYEILAYEGVESLNAAFMKVRKDYRSEGVVMYFTDKEGTTIGLLKKKTVWYILCRAIREKVRLTCNQCRKIANYDIEEGSKGAITKTRARVKDIQKWLGLSDETTRKWEDLAVGAIRYCKEQIDAKGAEWALKEIAERYPAFWEEYLESVGAVDNFEPQIDARDRIVSSIGAGAS